MQFSRIYIEILNYCNLNCPFCVKNKKPKKMITLLEFNHILDEIKPFTDYIYLHVQGEPLLHPNINEFITLARKKDFYVNITTNGTLLTSSFDISKVRQLNISLQAIRENQNEYYDNIVNLIKNNKDTYISLRLWGNFNDEKITDTINYFAKALDVTPTMLNKYIKLCDHVFFSFEKEFDWPSMNLPYLSDKGKCQGTISHVAILASGDVVPCCLDKDGIISFGNIYENHFSDIISSDRFMNMNEGFKNRKLTEELCKRCTYKERFNKKS